MLEAREIDNTLDSTTTETLKYCFRQHYVAHHGIAWYMKYLRRGDGWWNFWNDSKSSFPCHETPYLKTAEGSFGLCPPGTKPNDIIVGLYGGPVPFVLRKSEENSGELNMTVRYEFIRECFVEGFMHGAAIMHDAAIEEQKRGNMHQE